MKYIEVLKKMNIINVEQLIEEIQEIFNVFSLSVEEHHNILNNAAKIVVRKNAITYFIAKTTFKSVYIEAIKKKIIDGTLDIHYILKQNPQIKNNSEYKELMKVYKKKFDISDEQKLVFDLPFTTISIDIVDVNTITLLKNCTEVQYNYVFNHLSENEKNILVKKYGNKLEEDNELSIGDNEFLESVVLSKIDNMIKRFAGYYYFDQIFADKKNKYEQQAAYYELDNRYKRILINCYGPQLDKPLDNNISAALEHKLKNLVIPRLRSYKNIASNNRKISNFEKIFSNKEHYTLSMLPQGYIDIINIAVDNNDKVFSACSNSMETKILIRNIDALLELILSSEEFSILCYHYGLKDSKKLTFKEIAKKSGLTEKKISNIYVNILDKLILSPDIKKLFNFLNKPITEEVTLIVKSVNTPTKEKPNLLTSFYGYFTTEEIKKLRDGMTCMNADEILFVNSLFYLGLSQEINLKNITKQDKEYLEYIVKKIKRHISINNNLTETVSSQKIYKICSRIYVEPVYNEICKNLFVEEREILDLCIRYEELGDGTIKYISMITNKTPKDILAILKVALQKVYSNLEVRSKSNVFIRHLMLTEK